MPPISETRLSDFGSAADAVRHVLLAVLPPGVPPSFREITAARFVGTGRARKAVADLVMYDGRPATAEVDVGGRLGDSTVWRHRWTDMPGGACSWEGDRWVRCDAKGNVLPDQNAPSVLPPDRPTDRIAMITHADIHAKDPGIVAVTKPDTASAVPMRGIEIVPNRSGDRPTEHPTFLRKDWRAAAFFGGTDLGYEAWVAAQEAQGTTGWMSADTVRKLKRGTRLVVQVHESVDTDSERGPLKLYPGDILRVIGHEIRGGRLEVTILVDAADEIEGYEEIVTLFDDEERGGLYPLSRAHVTRLTPPWPGDRLFDECAPSDAVQDLTIAALHDDQTGLARGFYRVLDQRGIVHLCGRHGDHWSLSQDGEHIHDHARAAYLRIQARRAR
jgi:hypothetical protein